MRAECPRSPEERGACWQRKPFSDCHHIYWPANRYKTPLEKRFRQLPENKEQICRCEHDDIHFEAPPVKPTLQEMRDAIAGIALEGYDDDEAA